MTKARADAIRQLVLAKGWEAVRKHPVLGPVWLRSLKESKDYVDKVVDR